VKRQIYFLLKAFLIKTLAMVVIKIKFALLYVSEKLKLGVDYIPQ